MRPCDRDERRICTEKEKGIPIVKRGSKEVYKGAAEEGIYLTIQITTDGTSIFCREEEWKEVHGARLQIFK